MRNKELYFLTIGELSKLIEKKEVSPVEVTSSLLERIDQLDGPLGRSLTLKFSRQFNVLGG